MRWFFEKESQKKIYDQCGPSPFQKNCFACNRIGMMRKRKVVEGKRYVTYIMGFRCRCGTDNQLPFRFNKKRGCLVVVREERLG